MAKRTIICDDALDWLSKMKDVGSIVTSLPDIAELGDISSVDYERWFVEAAMACLRSASAGCPVVFYQTDRLYKGKRLSKAFLTMMAAEALKMELVWHKIVLKVGLGKINLRRPGYAHLLAFGDSGVKAGKASADVVAGGKALYPNGMPIVVAQSALQFAYQYSDAVVDPFVGRGTVPVVAEMLGFKSIIGIDIDPEQVKIAEKMKFDNVKRRRLKK